MNGLQWNSDLCARLTTSLLHLMWVGTLLGCAALLVRRFLQRQPAVSYVCHFGLLALMAFCLPVIFLLQGSPAISKLRSPNEAPDRFSGVPVVAGNRDAANVATGSGEQVSIVEPNLHPTFGRHAIDNSPQDPTNYKSWLLHATTTPAVSYVVTVVYGIGVGLMLLRLLIGCSSSARLHRSGTLVTDASLLLQIAQQAQRLRLRAVPLLAICEQVVVPTIAGILRPVVLIPSMMLTGLTSEQLDAVLAHELAHLRRRDHILIVIQRLLEAVVFFHPVTWYLSRRINTEREASCDDLVVQAGHDALDYSQSLLRVVELRQRAVWSVRSSLSQTTSLASDGHHASALRERIARLLGCEPQPDVRIRRLWLMIPGLMVASVVTLQSVAVSVEGAASNATTNTQDDPKRQTNEQNAKSERVDIGKLLIKTRAINNSRNAIKTMQAQFLKTGTFGEYREGLTAGDVQRLLREHPPTSRDSLRKLVQALAPAGEGPVGETPWSNSQLFRDGKRIRTTTRWSKGGPDAFVTNGEFNVHWDEANHQVNIMPSSEDFMYEETLEELLRTQPWPWLAMVPDSTAVDDGVVRLQYKVGQQRAEVSVQADTGCPVRMAMLSPNQFSETYYFGWHQHESGVWCPSAMVEIEFRDGNLDDCSLLLMESVQFNSPLPEGVFQLGAPAGSVINDKREGAPFAAFSINHDIQDVTSFEQQKAAAKPLSMELTDDEKRGVAEATQIYKLADGEVFRHIGEPFPAARKYVSRMLREKHAYRHSNVSRMISQDGEKQETYFSFDGGRFDVGHLARTFAKVHSVEIECPQEVRDLEIPGDFVFRVGAPKEELLKGLENVLTAKLGRPVRLDFQDVERTVYIAEGNLELNIPAGRDRIDMNGGTHTGDFGEMHSGGNLNQLFSDLSEYIGTRIENKVAPSDEDRIQWSRRWYDLDSTKPEDRFVIGPEIVLQQITDQTGITFRAEKQTVKSLVID